MLVKFLFNTLVTVNSQQSTVNSQQSTYNLNFFNQSFLNSKANLSLKFALRRYCIRIEYCIKIKFIYLEYKNGQKSNR